MLGLRAILETEQLGTPLGRAVLGSAIGLSQSMAVAVSAPLAGLPAILSDALLPDTCAHVICS